MERDLKREVTVRRPSSVSKVRVLSGCERRVVTRVRSVEDWMAGQFRGSRRSRRSCCVLDLESSKLRCGMSIRSCRFLARKVIWRVGG